MKKTLITFVLFIASTNTSFAQSTTESFMKACESDQKSCNAYLIGLMHGARFFNEAYAQIIPNFPKSICIPSGTSQQVAVNSILEHIKLKTPSKDSQITEDVFIALKKNYGCNP